MYINYYFTKKINNKLKDYSIEEKKQKNSIKYI